MVPHSSHQISSPLSHPYHILSLSSNSTASPARQTAPISPERSIVSARLCLFHPYHALVSILTCSHSKRFPIHLVAIVVCVVCFAETAPSPTVCRDSLPTLHCSHCSKRGNNLGDRSFICPSGLGTVHVHNKNRVLFSLHPFDQPDSRPNLRPLFLIRIPK